MSIDITCPACGKVVGTVSDMTTHIEGSHSTDEGRMELLRCMAGDLDKLIKAIRELRNSIGGDYR